MLFLWFRELYETRGIREPRINGVKVLVKNYIILKEVKIEV